MKPRIRIVGCGGIDVRFFDRFEQMVDAVDLDGVMASMNTPC